MQGNRVTQRSGLVEASYLFYLGGVDGRHELFLLLQLFTHPFPFIPPPQFSPILHLPFQKFPFLHRSVSITSRNWVLLVSLLIRPICVLSATL